MQDRAFQDYLEEYSADVAMERPYAFSVGEEQLYLYPHTLGKIMLTSRLVKAMQLQSYAKEELLNNIHQHRDTACRIIAYATCKGYEEVFNERHIEMRTELLALLDDKDLVTLLIAVLTANSRDEELRKHLGLTRERANLEKAQKAKKEDKNTLTFGGVSIFGSLIDAACERYGWHPKTVLWEVSYELLQLMLEDSIKTVYLTDKERKKVHISNDKNRISADDPNNLERIMAMRWD